MNYFLGIDGGGTKTKCVLIDEGMNKVFEVAGNASNPLVVGFSKSASIIADLIKQVYRSSDIKKIDSIVIGLAGAGRQTHADEIKREVLDLLSVDKFEFNYFSVVSDAEAALEGAFAGKSGAIIISGTGSIVFGKSNQGKVQRVGGYGKIIGDDGSGYSIACKGLSAVAKELDGFKTGSLLTKILNEEFHLASKEDLINKIYSKNFDVASVAQLVINCAEQGDKICRKIIRDEIKELVFQLELLKQKLKINLLNVALSGGIAGSENYFAKELEKKIRFAIKDVEIKKIKHPAEIGAALIAKKLLTKN